jgi:hypothetical protein
MSGMHGGNHDSQNLPLVLVGNGGGVLKTGTYINFPSEQMLQDVHLTVLNKVFGSPLTQFGTPQGKYVGQSRIITEILA